MLECVLGGVRASPLLRAQPPLANREATASHDSTVSMLVLAERVK